MSIFIKHLFTSLIIRFILMDLWIKIQNYRWGCQLQPKFRPYVSIFLCKYVSSILSKKESKKNRLQLLWYLNSNCFRSVFGRIEGTKKRHFEIKWPLIRRLKLETQSTYKFITQFYTYLCKTVNISLSNTLIFRLFFQLENVFTW